ncbi:CRISPR-associated endonuclease Cas2 [Candidatus Kaiserbacteria bacterium]|nr:CRISPR-associated endonuclease Cas2 [Candidatus Kaiserbacteria bacterium]
MKKMRTETRGRYLPMRNLILRTLAMCGVLSVALMAPKALTLLKKLDRGAANRKNLYRRITQAISRLERSGLVRTSGQYASRRVTLTKKGRATINMIYASEYRIPEQAFWDGKWRIVMFDIREKRRKTRSQLRFLLFGAGFLRLQDSVWVYPYPCDEFISLVRAHLKSGTGEMLSFVAEALESDRKLREHFRLPQLS